MSARDLLAELAKQGMMGMDSMDAEGLFANLAELEQLEAAGWKLLPPGTTQQVPAELSVLVCASCGLPLNDTQNDHDECEPSTRFRTARYVLDTDTEAKE